VITQAVLCGAGLGVGVWALLIWILPPRPSLAQALAATRATPPPRPPLTVSPQPVGWVTRIGAPAARLLARVGLPSPARRRDLQVLGGAPETFLVQKAVLALTGLLVPTLIQTVLLAGGLTGGWQFPLLAGLIAAASGFWLPDIQVRGQAAHRRTTFRHALSAYLNLIRVTLAGGAGVEAALWDAAGVGDGPAFVSLRRALGTARLTAPLPGPRCVNSARTSTSLSWPNLPPRSLWRVPKAPRSAPAWPPKPPRCAPGNSPTPKATRTPRPNA
jgi:tight adherence protein C